MNETLLRSNITFASICGVPYTALPIASVSVVISRDFDCVGLIVKRSSVRIIKNQC